MEVFRRGAEAILGQEDHGDTQGLATELRGLGCTPHGCVHKAITSKEGPAGANGLDCARVAHTMGQPAVLKTLERR